MPSQAPLWPAVVQGAGLNQAVVITSGTLVSSPYYLLSYAAPRLLSLVG